MISDVSRETSLIVDLYVDLLTYCAKNVVFMFILAFLIVFCLFYNELKVFVAICFVISPKNKNPQSST